MFGVMKKTMIHLENKAELKPLGDRWQLTKLREGIRIDNVLPSDLHEAFGFQSHGRAIAHVGSQRVARA